MKELTKDEQTRWKSIIVDIMRELHQICEENNLRYFCCGGTAIGCVRHRGLIPWDDDIDVSMPRPDYDRLIEVCRNRDMGKYKLIIPEETPDYPLPFMKLINRETSLIERANTPCHLGLFVDIFPLDGTSDDIETATAFKLNYNRVWHKLEACSCYTSFMEHISLLGKPKEWGRFVTKTIAYFMRSHMRNMLFHKLDAICRTYDYNTSKNVIVYAGSYNEREIMPKSFCDGAPILMPFEDIMVYMPCGYDEYLTRIYGDYMKMPPKDKQVSHHFHAVVNMNRRLTDDEIKQELSHIKN